MAKKIPAVFNITSDRAAADSWAQRAAAKYGTPFLVLRHKLLREAHYTIVPRVRWEILQTRSSNLRSRYFNWELAN